MKIAFIGLGNMGKPMARNLIAAGHSLNLYNRTRQKAEEAAQGTQAQVKDSPREAASGCEILITMLADDAAVEQVLFGKDGAFDGLSSDAIHVSMSTISVAFSKRLEAEHSKAGHHYVASPVFGRPKAAESASLAIIAGGASSSLQRIYPVLEKLGEEVFAVGEEPWKANIAKLSGNFMIASMLEAFGESLAVIRKAGVAPQLFVEVMGKALFKSPLYESYGTLIASESFGAGGFALKHGLKDVSFFVKAAQELDTQVDLARQIEQDFRAGLTRGMGEQDWSAISKVIEQKASPS